MRRFPHTSGRGGFTLVELLVVITIIAILFGLIAAATVKMVGKGDELKVRNEVSQLAAAVQAFKQQFAVGYVPDRVILPPVAQAGDSAAVQQLVANTQQYLKSVWPRLPATSMASAAYWQTTGRQVLHGDQCLVFFLGGTRDGSGNCVGFSTDPTDPMKLTGNRITPFFTFPTDRLRVFNGPSPEVPGEMTRAIGFPSFVDIYGSMPYVYFSTGKADNNYMYATSVPNSSASPSNPAPYNQAWFSVTPYQTSSTRFVNPASFQVISAGKDMTFGVGGLFWAGGVGGGATQQSYDDVANFHPTQLGVPAQ